MLPDIAGFRILAEHSPAPTYRAFDAILPGGADVVRLLLFDADLSRRPEFRRAFKTDRAMLSMLQHQNIPRIVGSGEHDGALMLWSQPVEATPLSAWRQSGRTFTTDDVVEIGWQICSALQHAHNIGFSHGGLSAGNVLLSDSLQVFVTEFGLPRWMRAVQDSRSVAEDGRITITVSALASRADIEQDLSDLARLLQMLQDSPATSGQTAAGGGVSDRGGSAALLDRLSNRVLTPSESGLRPASAREFQGRLGEILIGIENDSMPLVDERKAAGASRRSIVVELFESPVLREADGVSHDESASPAWRSQILPIAIVIAVVALLCALAVAWR